MTPLSSRNRSRRARLLVEALEPRTLLSVTISSYALPSVAPNSAVYDSNGNLWVLNTADPTYGYALDEISTTAGQQTVTKVIGFDNTQYQPFGIAAGPDGMIYAADNIGSNHFGSIDAIDTGTDAISKIFQGTSQADVPAALAVTGSGAVWFVGGAADFGPGGDVIGRIDPTSHAVSETPTTAVPAATDAYGLTLAPSGSDSVWVAYDTVVLNNVVVGHNYIVSASFASNAVQVDATYAVNSGNPVADQYNYITSVLDGGGGTVWFTLAGGQSPLGAPDLIVQGVVSGSTLNQTAYSVPGATAASPVNVASLTFDAQNNLWFTEGIGSQFGYLDTTGNFTTYNTADYTDGQPFQMVTNPPGTQLSIMTYAGPNDAGVGPIIQIDEAPAAIPFSFTSVSTLNTVQGTDINGTLLAMFTGPTPTTGYTATITWSDGSTSSGVIQAIDANDWAITAPSKTFSTAGDNLTATLTVSDGATTVQSTPLSYNVSAIPLDATSLSVTPIIARYVLATGTFTNDGAIPMSTVSATINWGDNTTSTGLIVRDPTNPNEYFVLGIHRYRTKGTYAVSLTVSTTDPLAEYASSSITSSVTVK